MIGIRPHFVPAASGEGGIPDPAALGSAAAAALVAGRPIRSVVVTLPDNPTGRLPRPATVRAVCQVAAAHGLIIICDEIYRDLVHDPAAPILSPAQVAPQRTVVTTGLSKNLALGGWRIGVARMPDGPLGDRLRGALLGAGSEIWSAPATPIQQAAALAFTEPAEITERIAASRALHATICKAVADLCAAAGLTVPTPQAAFYLYPDFEPWRDRLRARHQVTTGAALARLLLDRYGAGTLPASAFGEHPDALRLRLATGLLYGDSQHQRATALTTPDPLTLPWIAAALTRLEHILTDLANPALAAARTPRAGGSLPTAGSSALHPVMYQDPLRVLCTFYKAGRDRQAAFRLPARHRRNGTKRIVRGVFMVRLKVAVAVAVAAGVLAGGLAIPSAASANAAQVVYAWGDNYQGQAGTWPVGGHVLSPVPVRGAAANVTQLSGGNGGFALSLRSDGTVWGWGSNSYHQLGDLSQPNSFAPVQIHGLPPGIVQVAAGGRHAAAVAADGSVWTWGLNYAGELGYPTPGQDSSPTPHQVPGLADVKQVAAGFDFTVALRSNGEVWTWGHNNYGQLGDGTHTDRATPARNRTGYGITQVSAGANFALARRPGSVWAWGANGVGQLGNGSAVLDSATPVIVDRRTQNATQIVAGWDHAFAVDPDGSLWAWGSNGDGELGLGVDGAPFSTPQKVPGLAGVTQLAAGTAESMALRSDGTLLVWGSEYYGLRGDGIPRSGGLLVPTAVTTVSGVTRIAMSGGTVLVLAYAEIMPDVVGELRASALGHLHALGLSVRELSVPDPDRRCPHVGLVESQSPPPGSAVLPGGHATIHVYVNAQGGCL
jgi:aspartate aminotransferase